MSSEWVGRDRELGGAGISNLAEGRGEARADKEQKREADTSDRVKDRVRGRCSAADFFRIIVCRIRDSVFGY